MAALSSLATLASAGVGIYAQNRNAQQQAATTEERRRHGRKKEQRPATSYSAAGGPSSSGRRSLWHEDLLRACPLFCGKAALGERPTRSSRRQRPRRGRQRTTVETAATNDPLGSKRRSSQPCSYAYGARVYGQA